MFARTKEAVRRPHVVIAHSDPVYANGVARAFRRYGWGIAPAADGPSARRLAAQLSAELVVLQADLPGESGWLTCAKLTVGGERQPVILVSEEEGAAAQQFAAFAGASRLVTQGQGTEPLLEEVGIGMPVSQVV